MHISLSIQEIVSIIGVISNWLTLLVIFLTLKEMNSQRRHSYLPDIAPSNIDYFVSYWDENRKILMPSIWITNQNSKKITEEDISNRTYIRILNIGQGVAYRVKIKWDIDFSVIDKLNSICEKLLLDERLELYDAENFGKTLAITCKGEAFEYNYNIEKFSESNVSHILPTIQQNIDIVSDIPSSFITLFAFQLHLMDKSQKATFNFDFFESPPFMIKISYYDVSDNYFEKKYAGKININSFTLHRGNFAYNLKHNILAKTSIHLNQAFLGVISFQLIK